MGPVPEKPWWGNNPVAEQAASIRRQSVRLRGDRQYEAMNHARGEVSPLGGLSRPGSGARAQTQRDHLENNIRKTLAAKPRGRR
jgi:hypothetical protein